MILRIWTFFKAFSTAFCEYWTSIKVKINTVCVTKEYEIKTKMEKEKWLQPKMLFLLGFDLKIVFSGGRNKNLVGGIFLGGGGGRVNEQIIGWWGGGDSPILPVGKTLPFLLGSWAFYQIFKRAWLDRISIFRGKLLGKRRVTFFRGWKVAVFT